MRETLFGFGLGLLAALGATSVFEALLVGLVAIGIEGLFVLAECRRAVQSRHLAGDCPRRWFNWRAGFEMGGFWLAGWGLLAAVLVLWAAGLVGWAS